MKRDSKVRQSLLNVEEAKILKLGRKKPITALFSVTSNG
jgi:hypothetical protein